MEWFTVQYRDKDGSRAETEFEAESKSALFKILAEKKISAISVTPGRVGKKAARKTSAKKPATSSPKYTRGIIAGLIVIICAFAAFYFLSQGDKNAPEDKEDKKSALIPDVAKDIPAPKAEPVEEKKIDPNARPTKVGETLNGYIKLPSGRLHRVLGVVTNSASAAIKGKYEIFEHACDNEIAGFLAMEPGQGLVGTPRYNGRFKKDFLESLKHPIIVSKDDSPEDAALKRSVIQAKIDLKEAMDNGEDIEQIMLDTRAEMQDLARYKQELTQNLHAMVKEDGEMSTEDMETLVEAANKMLESKGIAPMKFGPLARRKLLMMQEQDAE